MNKKNIPPTQLWFGHHHELLEQSQEFLQNVLCKKNNCGTCIDCQNIRQQQHHALLWLSPEKSYTIAQLQPIFETISLQLAPDEMFFFILEHADALTPACANSLLKVMEEPPQGYHFILLAERPDSILPTIRSRSVVRSFYKHDDLDDHHPLLSYFTGAKAYDPRNFLLDLDRSKITERESIDLADQLLSYWMQGLKDAVKRDNKKAIAHAQKMVQVFEGALLKTPMPGSAKLYWKNLFLHVQ